MSKYFTVVLITLIYIFNEAYAEIQCPYQMSKKDCLDNLFSGRTTYFENQQTWKIMTAFKSVYQNYNTTFTKHVLQIFDVHNWLSDNYVNLFNLMPNMTLEQLISIVHYGDGKWWAPFLEPSFNNKFGTIDLIKDLLHGFKKMLPLKKWLEEFVMWQKKTNRNTCTYQDVKPIFSIYANYETKRNLSNEILNGIYSESQLPENTSHVIFEHYCTGLNIKIDETEKKELFKNFSLIINERLIDFFTDPYCLWNLNDMINFLVDSIKDTEEVPKAAFREDLIKTAIRVNFNKETLESFTNKIKSTLDLVDVAEALNLIVPYINGDCTESDLSKLSNVIIKLFKKYSTNREEVVDQIKQKLKNNTFIPKKLISELISLADRLLTE
ncbi:uncharacterized protein LOC142333492 [Lycorma delicatula]|uniref:uncharacterized protein LOC142333492 n=1 Tax=Lycorma delicatula TaxID=130591 RepID=UPI003F50D9F7